MSNKGFLVLAALLSFFVYTSCIESNKNLGGQFVSEDFVLKLDTAQFEIPVTSVHLDSIQGYSSSYMSFGYLNDETFGYTSGGFATNIAPYTDSTYLGIDPELKSLYIYMSIDSVSVLREDQRSIPQNIYVYKLKTALDTLKMFNTSITPDDYDPTPISVGSPVFFGDDSIKIYLSEEFGRELLATSVAEYDSVDLFMERIKGIYITTDSPDVEPGGGRINYITMGSPTIYMSYRLTDPQRGWYKKDTTETFSLGYTHVINTARTSSQKLSNQQVSETIPIQTLDGVKPYIKGEDLKQILNTWISKNGFTDDKVLISRAALVFPYEFDMDRYQDYNTLVPQQIYPCTYTTDGSLRFLNPLNEIYNSFDMGVINRSLKTYTCEVTRYIQDLIQNQNVSEKDDLYICPILSYTTSSGSSYDSYYYYMYGYSTSSESTFYGMDNQYYRHGYINGSLHQENRPVLQITYCTLH